MHRIFIVEDDPVIAGAMEKYISGWGNEVKVASALQDILPEFRSFQPHLVLLDISLPFYDGYHWCQEIRKISHVPVIFISSASENLNIIMAMNMGGDDFIAKPFDLSVLMAKIQALLRRTYDFSGELPQLEAQGAVLSTGDACLLFHGERIELSKNEYRILEALLTRKGSVVSRETLMEKLWETDCYVDENTLTVNVSRLKKKLTAAGLENFIVTKKGMGYMVP
jgi:DNA-binding response OmpR family regulator